MGFFIIIQFCVNGFIISKLVKNLGDVFFWPVDFWNLFFFVFTAIVILSYKSDKKRQPQYFKGSYKVLVGFIIAFSLLVLIKYLTQQ